MSNARFSIIQAKAVRDQRVTDSQLRTLNALGIYGDKDGWCFPKQSTLGEDVGKTQQNISKDVTALVKLGYIQSFPQYDKVTGARMQNKYRLLFDFPEEDPLLAQRDDTPTQIVERESVDNAPLNAPYNNTANDENPVIATLPIEWQVLAGVEEIIVPDQKDAQYKDTANLIAMQGFGVDSVWAAGIAYAFMKTRGINIPQSKIKGQRKAVKEMMDMGVAPIQVEEATKQLMDAGMTVTDLYSVAKTAIALANPAPDQNEYHGASEGV